MSQMTAEEMDGNCEYVRKHRWQTIEKMLDKALEELPKSIAAIRTHTAQTKVDIQASAIESYWTGRR